MYYFARFTQNDGVLHSHDIKKAYRVRLSGLFSVFLMVTGLGVGAYSNTVYAALPVLSGTFETSGSVNDNATLTPFSGVTVSDSDGDNVSVNITYTGANGTLTGVGLTGSAGNYTLTSNTAATVTTRLQALTFTTDC